MSRARLALIPALLLSLWACEEDQGFSVCSTLDDGQVVVGQVRTDTLLLEGGLGTLEIPLADVGEVAPVEGGALEGSGGHVSVWLRDGTELVGRWSEPELTMGMEVGGDTVDVDLPVDELERFQMQGGAQYPSGEVYRVRTAFGDDFLVDPERTRLVVDSSLGTFSPWLSECASAQPVADPEGPWRVVLHTGTVLVGPLSGSAVTFSLPMGPDELTVPLESLAGLERQYLTDYREDWSVLTPVRALKEDSAVPEAQAPRPAPATSGEWFSNEGLKMQRDIAYSQ